ncbi:unnamed protein product [Phytophthora fragariaefolia]|uniref:Unnamed protein product n=1 Tax=Phytophthora fragariaefolia TaxID=1490495 RepID=A0A9W7D438_9STRA|nr:unnamed protein product [Phytophthora fragariaefolia]
MRPWAETFRRSERNGALRWEYLHIGESFGTYQYLLVLKDDATHFASLCHALYQQQRLQLNRSLTGIVATECLGPWTNGSIERLNRDIVQVFRAMCLEVKVDIRDWVHFIPVVQSNLNHTPVPSLANKAPVELFCVLPVASPLGFGFNGEDNTFLELGTTSRQIEAKLTLLRARVQQMHKRVQLARSEQTRRNQKMQRCARVANFDIGDYMLRSRVDQKTQRQPACHMDRPHVAAQGIFLMVAELKKHRWNSAKRCYEILVGWKGLEPIEDSWESLSSLYKDIPVMVKQYVAATSEV